MLQRFVDFLESSLSDEEETFVVDGANVGYTRKKGCPPDKRFNFAQIELIVDTLLSTFDGGNRANNKSPIKIIVVLPSVYSSRRFPNSMILKSNGARAMSLRTPDDEVKCCR